MSVGKPSLVGLGDFNNHAKASLTNLVQHFMVLTPTELLSSSNGLTQNRSTFDSVFFKTWQREGVLYVSEEIRIHFKGVDHFLLNLKLVLTEGFLNA